MITYRTRVYYEDTDCLGLVYHSRYLQWMARARTEYFASCGIPLTDLGSIAFVVHQAKLTWHKPAKLGDEVTLSCEPTHLGHVRSTWHQVAAVGATQCCEAVITLACVAKASQRPTRCPHDIHHALESSHEST